MFNILYNPLVLMDITAKFMLGRTNFFIFYNLDFIVSIVKSTILLIITFVSIN